MSELLHLDEPKHDLSAKGIWQRLPEETPSAYAAFCAYLELGPDSTLSEVAEKISRTPNAVRHLSRRHHWIERAAAYRQHLANASLLAAQSQDAKQAELCRMRDRIFRQELWEASQSLFAACLKSVSKLELDDKEKIAPYELANLFNLCLRLGDRASEPTQFTCEGASPSSLDFDAAVEKVYGNMTLEQVEELLKTFPPPKTLPSSNTKPAPTDPNG